MKGCLENFVIFWCISVHDMNPMWFEFRSSLTTPSWFFTEKSKKYTQYLTVLTNKNIWHKIWLILHHPKKFEHNWIKNGPAVRFYFWTLFANLNFLNFIACAIVQWRQKKTHQWWSLSHWELFKHYCALWIHRVWYLYTPIWMENGYFCWKSWQRPGSCLFQVSLFWGQAIKVVEAGG